MSFAATRADGASADNALDVCNGSDAEEVVEHIERDAEKLVGARPKLRRMMNCSEHTAQSTGGKAPDCKVPVSNKGESETDGDLENKSSTKPGTVKWPRCIWIWTLSQARDIRRLRAFFPGFT